MKVPAAVLEGVDYIAIVNAERSARNRYLPPPIADRALLGNADELAERLRTRMRRGFEPAAQDSILARKMGRGSRPLPYIALEDRLVYRALVNAIAERLPAIPGRGDYDTFARSPLDIEDCRFVLKADIAAFYQYVDHERLIDEVVAQTGDDLAVTAVVELLQGGTGRRFGLPQMNAASDILADMYVDPIRRNLLRSGHAVSRYADDFRVACRSYSEALASLEQIERSAFDLGLVLSEAKTSTPHLRTYEESLSDVSNAERQLFDALAEEGVAVEDFFDSPGEPYGDDDAADVAAGWLGLPGVSHDEADPPDEPDPPDVPTIEQLEVAFRVLSLWNNQQDLQYEWSGTVWATLLRKSLYAFEIGRDDRAVSVAISLLVREPHLTPQVCGYLASVGQETPDLVHGILDELCSRDIVSIWQSLWLAYLAGTVAGGSRNAEHVNWLRDQVDSVHDSLSAQAALALAQRRFLTVRTASQAYERAPHAHRPTVALALAAAHGVAGSEFVYDDQTQRWLASWAATQRWGRQPTKRPVKRIIGPRK